MKKGQTTQTLMYIVGGIIFAIVVYYGVSSVFNVQERTDETNLELLKNTISNDVSRISSQYASNRTHSYQIGPDFSRICFADTTKNPEIALDLNAPEIIRIYIHIPDFSEKDLTPVVL